MAVRKEVGLTRPLIQVTLGISSGLRSHSSIWKSRSEKFLIQALRGSMLGQAFLAHASGT
eukprot:scaffold32361_cov143-Skeletonema_menzelii.AAC.7